MLPIVFQTGMFEKPMDEQDFRYSHRCLLWMLECLVNCNIEYLREYPETPLLYRTGVTYTREKGTEDWSTIKVLLKTMKGDCEDLGAARVAEMRLGHKQQRVWAKPRVKFRNVEGFWHYHIQLEWPNGRVEDPSRILGMNSAREGKPISQIKTIRTVDLG